MTRTWLVSLLSDQMVPNILLARQLRADGMKVDRHLLISTDSMEKKGKSGIYRELVDVAEQDVHILKVDPRYVGSVFEMLGHVDFGKDDSVLVNLTGGTKVMSMGAFNWFSVRNHVAFYYLPVGSDVAHELDSRTYMKKEERPITVRLSVKEYLASYGVSIENVDQPDPRLMDWMHQHLSALWELFRDGQSAVWTELGEMRKANKKSLLLPQSGDLVSWLDDNAFPLSRQGENRITKQEVKFLTGDWLEWLVAEQVRGIHPDLAGDEIMCGVQIKRDNAKNELDVIYMQKNAPRVIECKTMLEREFFDEAVYKLSTLSTLFGLTATSAIVALHLGKDLREQAGSHIKKSRASRLESLKIGFVHVPEPDPDLLERQIRDWESKRGLKR